MLIERAGTRSWGVIAVVTLIAAAACTADGSADPKPAVPLTTLSTEIATSTTSGRCEADDGSAAALEPLVTDDLPADYDPAPDAAEDTGPTDLDLAAFLVGDPDEQAVLSRLRFRRGYQRLWYEPDGSDDLIVHLYEFCDAQGAADYLRHTRQRLLSPLSESVEVDVAGLSAPGVGLLQGADPGSESFVAILRVDGPFYVEIGAYGITSQESLDTLIARARRLSEAQVAELP